VKIGITIDTSISIKNSRLNQNLIFLGDSMKKAGVDVIFLTNKNINPRQSNITAAYIIHANHYMAYTESGDMPKGLSMLIEGGFSIDESTIKAYRTTTQNFKHIKLCPNHQINLDVLDLLTEHKGGKASCRRKFDEVWTWNFLENTATYLSAVYGCEIKKIPYLWDTRFINRELDILKKKGKCPKYKASRDGEVCIFEKNIMPSANCLIPLSICENLNKKRPEIIKSLNITNCQKLKQNARFSDIIDQLSLKKQKKIFLNNEWNNVEALARWGKVVILYNQNESLSSKHLELMHLEIPILHNCEEIKEYGYHYNIKTLKNATNQLEYALTMHNENADYYKGQARECIRKFSPDNTKNINQIQSILGV
tara:strand:- start:152 stop:1252 length:1101 start_codon:yes stop_codon:yes gene_type:complete